MGILRRLVSGYRPHHDNRESRTGSDVVITRISCPIQAGAIEMPLTAGTHSGYAGSSFRGLIDEYRLPIALTLRRHV